MTSTTSRSTLIAAGFAMFSMFFGAGNIVFALAIGQYAKDQSLSAILGLLITAVGVPILGLVAITLYNGNYKHFFERMGPIPGFLVSAGIMGLIGPFGAIPRCIAFSYSTLSMYSSTISLPLFSLFAVLLIFALTFKQNKLLDVLGYVLTPIKLTLLLVIIIKGIMTAMPAPPSDLTAMTTFLVGLNEGYQTMDLLGAFFFSSVVISCLEQNRLPAEHKNYRQVIFLVLKASVITALLLGSIYAGFSYVAAANSNELASVDKDQYLGALALQILGPYAGILAIAAVCCACLTTAIALSAVFAEFLHKEIFRDKVSYVPSLIITLIATYFVSTLKFSGIASFLVPILQVCYPALIVLSIMNIAFKLYHVQTVKVPVYVTFALSLVSYFIY